MNGATTSEVLSARWIAMLFGASSPKTTCMKETRPKATGKETA